MLAFVFAAEFGYVDVVFAPEWYMFRASFAKIISATGSDRLSNWKVIDCST